MRDSQALEVPYNARRSHPPICYRPATGAQIYPLQRGMRCNPTPTRTKFTTGDCFFNPLNPSTMSKRQSKAGRTKGQLNKLAISDQETITKALNIVLKTLCKRMDKLSDKDLIVFMAELAPYGWHKLEAAKADNDKQRNKRTPPTQTPPKPITNCEKETITKALHIILNTLCKKIDRLKDKDLVLFMAEMAPYGWHKLNAIPPEIEKQGVQRVSFTVDK